MDLTLPFALLHDEAAGGMRLFTGLTGEIVAQTDAGVRPALAAMDAAQGWLAGGIGYEAGHALEPRLAGLGHAPGSLWFGQFARMDMLEADAALAMLRAAAPGRVAVGAAEPQISRQDFEAMVARVQALIAAGDIYQANVTLPALVAVHGHPAALFARLWAAGRPPLGGLVHRGGGRWWLCLSPELFFRSAELPFPNNGARVVARPMKGTAPRAADPAADAALAAGLRSDPKNRAENLMIADLIRNDLSRVAVPGSVKVPRPFAVEAYPSLHQLTSEVVAALADGVRAVAVLEALFPCGSITGAPKLRAMAVIADVEAHARGIYCGAIGWIAPGGRQAGFAVAIRTLSILPEQPGAARLGLGAGIVADSVAADEWRECLLKGQFLSSRRPLSLIETMRRDADGRIVRLDRHLARMAGSAGYFGWRFSADAARARLAMLPATPVPQRVRLLLSARGQWSATCGPMPAVAPMTVALGPQPLDSGDWRLWHKSGDRAFYDDARKAGGADELLFITPDGRLTEGSFTSLFVEQGGRLLTPPAHLGLLPGVLRAELLESGMAVEAELRVADLADGFLLGNSLRGLIPARLAPAAASL